VKIIPVIILFALLLTVNFFLRKSKSRMKYKPGIIDRITRLFPLLEMLFWAAFFIWAFNYIFKNSDVQYFVNILLITLCFVLIFWFFIKDYFYGIQIRSRFSPDPGKNFKSDQGKGIIRKVGLLTLELKTENGSTVKVPYSQIDQKSVELNFEEKRGGESTFKVDLNAKQDEETLKQKITQLIINSPWSSYKSMPVIKVTAIDDKLKSYEISCITTAETGVSRLKELIQKRLG
jgi:hypothetical protein